MTGNVGIEKKDDYLLVTIQDNVITKKRASEILGFISEQSNKLKCNKILLDERTVESRDVTTDDILKLSIDMTKKGPDKIYIAFLCNRNLINKDTKLLRMFTYTNEFVLQYFTEQNEAVAWLQEKNISQ